MFDILIDAETAEKDITAWMDNNRVKPPKRLALAANIAVLTEAIMYGDVIVNADCSITHKLNFPILDNAGEVAVKQLEYKPRLTLSEVQSALSSQDSLTLAYGVALTGKPAAIIGKLDSSDARILSSIGVFFIN